MNQAKHSTLKTIPIAAFLALAALMLTPVASIGQQSGQQEVLEVLERTEEYLSDVRALVMETDSDQARMILGSAVSKQIQARQQYQSERYVMAVRLSLKAREIASQAERMMRSSRGHEERARQYLDRLHELHERVRERAEETDNAQAMAFVRQAENLYMRARQQFEQTRFENSLRLLQEAEAALNRGARLLFAAGDSDRLLNDMERIGQLIVRARERLGDDADPAIMRSLERVERTLDDARMAFESDQPLRAMRLTQRARQEVERVLRQSSIGLTVEAVQREIDRFDERQIRLLDEVTTDEARRQLDRAGQLRDEAGQVLRMGDKELALRTIRSALNLQRLAGESPR